jgi:hypothetical protein
MHSTNLNQFQFHICFNAYRLLADSERRGGGAAD